MSWEDSVSHLDMTCPKCGSGEGRSQRCQNIHCDDGQIDDHEEDPINSPPGTFYDCPECKGQGACHWCSECGYHFTPNDFNRDRATRGMKCE